MAYNDLAEADILSRFDQGQIPEPRGRVGHGPDPVQISESRTLSSFASRRGFLSGGLAARELPRPPGSGPEDAFRAACDGCGACVAQCPEGVLASDDRGLAFLDATLGACTFCGICIDVCETGALSADAPWSWRAEIAGTCLSLSAVHCRTCEDHCDARALRFRPATGGRATPVIDGAACTGCGGCVAACPVGAVSLKRIHPQAETLS